MNIIITVAIYYLGMLDTFRSEKHKIITNVFF